MRPTIDQIKEAIRQEATKHGILQESCEIDKEPIVQIPGSPRIYRHKVACKCGHVYELMTQHSANTPAGSNQFHQALSVEMTDHAVNSAATMIFEMHEPTQ